MPFLLTSSIAAAAILHAMLPASSLIRSESVLVRSVVDGDTIDVATVGRVRLLGIDAPELGRGFDTAAPFGREAKDRLMALVLHRWVRLEQEPPLTDAYSRKLAYVIREDGLFVNAVLVREGLARVTARVPLERLGELKRAEAEAQGYRRGMWGDAPQIPSASYTSSAKRAAASTTRVKTKKSGKATKTKKANTKKK